jgi:hypothetical protein
MQPNLDPAWTALRDQLVAAGANAQGTAVLLPRANRAVAITTCAIAGATCVILIAPIGRAHECDSARALLLANELEVGSMIVVKQMLALRHAVPLADASLDGVMQIATVLARTAAGLAPALTEPSRTRSIGATSAFAHVAE